MSSLILALVLSAKCPGGACHVPAKAEQPAATCNETAKHRRKFQPLRRLFRGCKGC